MENGYDTLNKKARLKIILIYDCNPLTKQTHSLVNS